MCRFERFVFTHFRCCQTLLRIVLHQTIDESDFVLCGEARENVFPFFAFAVRKSFREKKEIKAMPRRLLSFLKSKEISFNYRSFSASLHKSFVLSSDAANEWKLSCLPYFTVVGQILHFRPINRARCAERSNDKRQLLDVRVALEWEKVSS